MELIGTRALWLAFGVFIAIDLANVFVFLLVFTGVRMWLAVGDQPDLDSNPVLRWRRRHMRIAPGYDGERFFTRVDGGGTVSHPRMVVAHGDNRHSRRGDFAFDD